MEKPTKFDIKERKIIKTKTTKKESNSTFIEKYTSKGIIPGMISYENDNYFDKVLNY